MLVEADLVRSRGRFVHVDLHTHLISASLSSATWLMVVRIWSGLLTYFSDTPVDMNCVIHNCRLRPIPNLAWTLFIQGEQQRADEQSEAALQLA